MFIQSSVVQWPVFIQLCSFWRVDRTERFTSRGALCLGHHSANSHLHQLGPWTAWQLAVWRLCIALVRAVGGVERLSLRHGDVLNLRETNSSRGKSYFIEIHFNWFDILLLKQLVKNSNICPQTAFSTRLQKAVNNYFKIVINTSLKVEIKGFLKSAMYACLQTAANICLQIPLTLVYKLLLILVYIYIAINNYLQTVISILSTNCNLICTLSQYFAAFRKKIKQSTPFNNLRIVCKKVLDLDLSNNCFNIC